MPEEHRTKVFYEAIADFSDLTRKAREAKKAIKELREEEAKLNEQSAKSSKTSAVASTNAAKARDTDAAAAKRQAGAQREVAKSSHDASAAQLEAIRRTLEAAKASKTAADAATNHGNAIKGMARSIDVLPGAIDRLTTAQNRSTSSTSRWRAELSKVGGLMASARKGADSLSGGFDKLNRIKLPGIAAPLAVLVPAIAGVLALVNPLVAGLGAVGAAAIGMASSLGAAAGGLVVGIIPALVTLLGVVGAVKMAMGGVGNVFKAAKAAKEAKKAVGGGGGGGVQQEELTRAEKVARAQEQLRRATEDVKFAQDNLDEARKGYIERLKALKKAVEDAANAELRLRANQQLARENLANVLADPGATKGEKMAARAALAEANEDLKTGRKEAKDNAKELADMQKKGMEGDQDVIMAKRRLQDAIWAQRDAEIALANSHKDLGGAAGAAAVAADALADALAALSPSARKAVLALLAMQGALDKMKRTVQEAFFAPFADNVKNLSKLFPPLTNFFSDSATALGGFINKLITRVTSPEWLTDINILGKGNIPIIENMGEALISVGDVFKDVAVIAQPFLTKLTAGLASGAEKLSEMLNSARTSGSLAAFLEDSYDHLELWWNIIKNIGESIINFLRAAEPFGRWLTTGFENITQGWADASNSDVIIAKFQGWLEKTKPLLQEMGKLLGQFFGWFGREAADSGNIKQLTDMLKTIREDVGPAIGRIFDALSQAEVGPAVFEAIGAVFEAIADFLEGGGAEGMKTFWHALQGVAEALSIISKVAPDWLITALVAGFAAMNVMKFTGMITLIKWLLKLAAVGPIAALKNTGAFKALSKVPGAKAGALAATSFLPGVVGRRAAQRRGPGVNLLPGGASESGSGRRGGRFARLRATLADDSGFLDAGARRTPGTASRAGGILGKAGRMVKGGGLIGIAASVAAELVAGQLENGKKGARDTGSSVLRGAATGAGIGALVGSVIPGVGTAVGAGVGGVIGGGAAALGIDAAQWAETVEGIRTGWDESVIQPISDFVTWIREQWTLYVSTPFQNFLIWIRTMWQTYVVIPFQNFLIWIRTTWQTYVVIPFQNLLVWFRTMWQTYVVIPFQNMIGWMRGVWNGAVSLFRTAATAVQSAWNTMVGFFRGIPGRIESAWNSMVGFFQGIPGRIEGAWNGMLEWFRNVPGEMIQAVRDWVGQQVSNVTDTAGDAVGWVGEKLGFSGGGSVPGEGDGDTVPAMLTPGEYVIRKSVVDKVGLGALDRLNSGLTGLMSGRGYAASSMVPKHFATGGVVPVQASVGTAPAGITVGNLNINNPTAERAGDSLPRTIRKLSYIGRGKSA